jgi:zinc/manganese transport system permease protein
LLAGSLDPVVSAARGVPVRLLDVVYLVLVAIAVAQAVQVVGALLVLGLLAAPAATALRLTARPWRALGLAVAIAVADVWLGLAASQVWPSLPPSFAIVALAFAGLVAAQVARRPAMG